MTNTGISPSLRRRVLAEARRQCAYCHSLTDITGAQPVLDHIVPRAAGGATEYENLCLCCHACNEFKGAQVESPDPMTGQVVPLLHPRRQRWNDHFRWSMEGTKIVGITPVGRATERALNMNHPLIVEARRRWVAVGWHPAAEDLGKLTRPASSGSRLPASGLAWTVPSGPFARRFRRSLRRPVRSEVPTAERERGERKHNEFKYQGRAHNPGCGRFRSRQPSR